jgi:cytochrome c-type biogenesis protein CcmH/NrfG
MKIRISKLIVPALIVSALLLATYAMADESAPALLAAGRADDAINSLRSKISVSPNDGEAYNLLCRAYFSTGDWDRGISACEKAISIAPNNSRYHMWLGRIYGE